MTDKGRPKNARSARVSASASSDVRVPASARADKIPDAADRARIVTELDRNLLVEAGAGSGKTQNLAERMAAGIASGAYELERMAAVTFTRKAAAELRGRFQLALEAELALAGPSVGPNFSSADTSARDASDRRSRITRALSNLERFFAGTIHSFCARLLRERPVEAGVSPGFTELDDVEERLVREQSWREYRAQAKSAGDVDLMELLDAGITARQLDKAFETVCLYEDVDFPTGDAAPPDRDTAWRELETFWSALQVLLPAATEPDTTCKTQQRADRFRRQWRSFLRGNRDAALLAELMRCWESAPAVVQRRWASSQIAKQAEALHDRFRSDVVLPYLTGWRQHLYGRCISLLIKAREVAQAERRRRNALSFNDLLILTAKVLRENADVRRALQDKYRWLFVDEFQDTDPVQAEIMLLLAQDDDRPGALRRGALFVVGDPKQSIYRFRRADIDIYNDIRARLAGADGSGIVRLTTNFRSRRELCEWANDVFRERFPVEPGAHAPAFAPLEAYRDQGTSGPGVVALDIPAAVESSEAAGFEAEAIARYIQSEVAAGRRAYGDFLILTRKKKGLRRCAEELEKLEVPVEVTGAGAFGDSNEVRELALLLAALADPQDAVSLVGVLRGPLFGLSDRDLFAFRRAGGYFNLFASIKPDNAERDAAVRVSAALESLRRWYKWTRTLPPGAALERILDDSGYLALGGASRGGVEAGDLLHAIDRVRAVVEGGFTLADAAAALAAWSGLDEEPQESVEVDSLPLEPGRRDVVRLMNLHKAKGLEAAVVFLADPGGGISPRADIRVVRDGAHARGYFRIEQESDTSWVRRPIAEPEDWAALEQDELAYINAEVDRLLYVAATRAKDLLVIGRYGGKVRTPAWAVLTEKLAGAPSLAIPGAVVASPPATVDLSLTTAAAAAAAAAAAHEQVRRASWSATSVTAESKRLPKVAVETSDLADAASDPTRTVVPDTSSHRADAGAAWGTLVHGLLEHAMRHRHGTRDDLRRLALWLTMEEPQLRPVIEQAIDTALAVRASDALATARASSECHEEAPFAMLDPHAGAPVVVTGAIDLVYREDDGWAAVDYKTDADAKATDLAERHRTQIETYQRAWKSVSGLGTKARIVSAR